MTFVTDHFGYVANQFDFEKRLLRISDGAQSAADL